MHVALCLFYGIRPSFLHLSNEHPFFSYAAEILDPKKDEVT